MTGPTHRQYSICFGYLTLMLFHALEITKVNYYLALPIILLAAKSGALFPDLDHDWHNIGEKTSLNKVINVIIHVTGGKHRSWQTHSIDITLAYTFLAWFLPNELYSRNVISEINREVLLLLTLGFASGWISHILSDMLTSAGVRLVCWNKFKVTLVPKKLGPLKFNTGHEWEAFNFKVMQIINIFLGIICLGYPLVRNGVLENIINKN